MLKNSSHSIQILKNRPSVIRIRHCLHQKRYPFDFSGAIDCVTKSQYLPDSISSTIKVMHFSIFFGSFKLFFCSLSFKKKNHNFRSPETQTETKSGKIQMKTNSLHTIAGLRTRGTCDCCLEPDKSKGTATETTAGNFRCDAARCKTRPLNKQAGVAPLPSRQGTFSCRSANALPTERRYRLHSL